MEEKLIEAVRARKVLYDTSHEDYLKTKLKAENWEEVAKETDIRNGTEAKAMWEKLRHSLRDALRRQQKSMKSGAAAESVKQWKFQQQMGFLQPYMAHKTREGNLNEDNDDSERQSQNCDIDDVVKDKENIEERNSSVRDEAESQAPLEILPQTSSKSAKKKKKDTIAGLLKRSMEQHEERRKLRSEERNSLLNQTSAPSDPLYHFFISMYTVTKNMPLSSQFAVRKDIFRVVTDMEATLLNIPSQSTQCNAVQRPSYDELSPFSNQASQSYSNLSTPSHSSYSDSALPNIDERCEFQQNTSTTASSGHDLLTYLNTLPGI